MTADRPAAANDNISQPSGALQAEAWSRQPSPAADAGSLKADATSTPRSASIEPSADNRLLASGGPAHTGDGKMTLPALSLEHAPKGQLESLVMNSSAQSQERLAAVKALVDQGVHSFQLTDQTGHSARARLEVEHLGNKSLVHLFLDKKGGEKVALRGVTGADHVMHKERDSKGREVGFAGHGIGQFNHMHLAGTEVPSPPSGRQGQGRPGPQKGQPVPPEKETDRLAHPQPPDKAKNTPGPAREGGRSGANPVEPGDQSAPEPVHKTDKPAKRSDQPGDQSAPEPVHKTDKPAKRSDQPGDQSAPEPVHKTDKPAKGSAQPGDQSGRGRAKEHDRPVERPSDDNPIVTPAKEYELNHLDNRSANHNSPDAIVRLPANFDPQKPINLLIYNHGFGSTAKSAYQETDLNDQMQKAPPNTVLIVPEWQADAGSRSSNEGRFSQPGRVDGMIQEIFNKTPGLAGKSEKDIASINIVSHSAGYGPTENEIYKNNLQDKVKSITLLDSLYDGHGFDKWINNNIQDLSDGNKQFNNIYYGTGANSVAEAQRVQQMLKHAGLPTDEVLFDSNHPNSVLNSSDFAKHSIVFKHSTATVGQLGPHMSLPNIYIGIVNDAERQRS